MIAVHLDNFLFLLLVAVAVLFQFLAKTAGKTGKGQTKPTSTPIPRTPPPVPRASRGSDDEQIRKFLEALGQSPTSKPPPPVVPRTNIPPRPLARVQPPMSPLSQLKRAKPRKRDVIRKESFPTQPVRSFEEIVSPKTTGSPAFEVQEGPSPIAPPPIITPVTGVTQTIVKKGELRTDIGTLLESTSGLRNAIILREILGLPCGLRAIDLV
jgi:hypothetical protein